MADIKISELEPTTDLEGLYTIGSDKNNLSKKVSLQFLKDAANYANMQGDYAKEVGDSYEGKLTELESKVYSANLSEIDAEVYRTIPSSTTESDKGTRLRLIIPIGNVPCEVIASCSKGKGVSTALFVNKEEAIFYGGYSPNALNGVMLEYLNETYESEVKGTYSQPGFAVFSLCKDDSSVITDSDKAELLSATKISIRFQSTYENVVRLENSVFEDKVLTESDANVYRVQTSSVTESTDGTRLRLIFKTDTSCKVIASCSKGKGISTALFADEQSAIYYGGYSLDAGKNMLEYINTTYQKEVNGQYTQGGYIVMSLCKTDSSIITDSDKEELLSATEVTITQNIDRIERNTKEIQELKQSGGQSVSAYNKECEDAIKASAGVNTFVSGNYASYLTKKKNLTLAIVSDLHGDQASYQRYLEYINEHKDIIDYGVFLGDISDRQPSDNTSWFNNYAANSEVPLLSVVGNHDVAEYEQMSLSESSCRTKYFRNLNKGVVFMGENRCSWYLDNTNHKIRIIGLYEYCNSKDAINEQSVFQRRWLDSDILLWFANTLNGTPNGYKVVVLLHQTPHYPFTLIENDFTISEDLMKISQSSFLNTIDGNPICDIVDAYKNKKSINKTYSPISSYSFLNKTASINFDFSSAQGEFLMYFCGHWHTPLICKDVTYQNQITMANPSGSRSGYQRQWDDIPPTNNGRNQDNFAVVSLDVEKNCINMVKIGGQVTIDIRERKMAKLDL